MMQSKRLAQVVPWVLIIGGIIGFLCSFILTAEKMYVLQHPGAQLPCNLNPVISCGSVMDSAQSHIFGFDNPFIGLGAFAALITTGLTVVAGARFKRWYWLGLQGGAIGGVLFVHWLMFQSLYRIHSLCPYCVVVWGVTITTFWYVTLYNLQEGHIVLRGKAAQVAAFARKHHLDILVAWLLTIVVLILAKFWYYYGPLLGFK